MVDNILAAFREGVDKLEWMTPETKQARESEGGDDAGRRRLSGQLARLFRA